MPTERNTPRMIATAFVAVAVIIGAQFLAASVAPDVAPGLQSKIIGQAGFAYLGGLRMMGAGILWGRLDAQFHQYFAGKKIEDRLDMLPSIRMVQLLNPQLEQPYYYASYILMLRGKKSDALALAREGIGYNPTSGLLRANYCQLLYMMDRHKNVGLMLEQAKVGLSDKATYNSLDDQFEAYGIFRTVYMLAGDKATADAISNEQKKIRAMKSQANGSEGGIMGLINSWSNSAEIMDQD
jgi:hypothetical protein